MKTWLVLLGCLLAFTSSAQSSRREVWQWKDANGVTHFSDYPAPGARKIVLNGSPSSTAAEPPASAAVATRSRTQPAATEIVYQRLEIWSPDSGANFFFENLPAGEYTFKYRLRANLAGEFRAGPAQVQSIYAPAFVAYSAGEKLRIDAAPR